MSSVQSNIRRLAFLRNRAALFFNGLIHNPVINKRITLTDMSLETEISIMYLNCLIYFDLQFMPTKYYFEYIPHVFLLGPRNPQTGTYTLLQTDISLWRLRYNHLNRNRLAAGVERNYFI